MKKKIFILLIILSVFTLTGCSLFEVKKEEKKETETYKSITLDGYKLVFSEEGTFNDMSFMYPKGTEVNSLGTSSILVYSKKDSDESLYKIMFGKMENTTIDDAMKGFTKEKNREIKGITWEVYSDETGSHSYAYDYNGDIYVVGFLSDEYINRLEDEILKTVKFN